jgi:hypothetical protein
MCDRSFGIIDLSVSPRSSLGKSRTRLAFKSTITPVARTRWIVGHDKLREETGLQTCLSVDCGIEREM